MILWINCDDNPTTYNKKNYLMRTKHRDVVLKDIRDIGDAPQDYVLNIEPCTMMGGSKWSGLWHIDVLLNGDYYANIYGEADTAFISSNQSKYDMTDTQVLFQACDPVLHRRIPEIEQKYDYVMCGSNDGGIWQKRIEAFELLKTKYSYHDFGKDHKPDVYVNNINQARVQFIRTGEGDHQKGACAQRFFECLAIGPVLTNYTDDIPLLGLVEGEDFMTYKNDDEMMDKMETLINDEKLRDKIAKSGRQKAITYHSYEQRIVGILNTVDDFIEST